MTGAVIDHPLADWTSLAAYHPPSPAKHSGWGAIDWDATAENIRARREKGELTMGNLRHGHTFLTLTYLRGYEQVILDMADGEPRLCEMLGIIESFNAGLVTRYLALEVEWMGYPEDLGMQQGPMLSPRQFRRWIAPIYCRLIAPARAAGCIIHMHSDGDVRTLCNDLLKAGVDVLNLQDLVNGIDWIEANLKGRVCIDLDIDRQRITRFGTPDEIDALIRREVETLGSPEGGLMLTGDLCPGIPLENMQAIVEAMERYEGYYG